MIDLSLLREDPKAIAALITKKEPTFDVKKLLTLDEQVRQEKTTIEQLRQQRNELAKKGGLEGVTDQIKQQSIEIGKQIKSKESKLAAIEEAFLQLALSCPNIIDEDVPEGGKEQNKVVKIIGEKPSFSFTPKNHLELNEKLGWFDFQAATSMSGSNFVVYKHDGLKLLYALIQLMMKNNVKYGYEPVLPPYLVNEQALVHSGNLPKFKGDFYSMPNDGLCLIPTAEVSLTNLHANQILDIEELPLRYTAWTSCFRREAGSHGSDERGLIRIHQFEKAELYTLCHPQDSESELARMRACAQDFLQQLGLHYRMSLLAAQDCSFSAAKTYDIEVWLPGQNKYYEVSSCSNCTDFQARRAKIRCRQKGSEQKPYFVHTLNGSSLALPRLMVAIIEQYQQENGRIELPPILEEAMKQVW